MKGFGRPERKNKSQIKDRSHKRDREEGEDELNPIANPAQGTSWLTNLWSGTVNFVSEHLMGNTNKRGHVEVKYEEEQLIEPNPVPFDEFIKQATQKSADEFNASNLPVLSAFANSKEKVAAFEKGTQEQIATQKDISLFQREKQYNQDMNLQSVVRYICDAINNRISSLVEAGKLKKANLIDIAEKKDISDMLLNYVHHVHSPIVELKDFVQINQLGDKSPSGEYIMTHAMFIDHLVKAHGEEALDEVAIKMNNADKTSEKAGHFAHCLLDANEDNARDDNWFLDLNKLQPSSKAKPGF